MILLLVMLALISTARIDSTESRTPISQIPQSLTPISRIPQSPTGPATVRIASSSEPSFFRLADESDRAAFRNWFTLLADLQFEQRADEVTDCAALVRFAYREALRTHTPEWARRIGLPLVPAFADVRTGPKPRDGRWPLFRTEPPPNAAFGEFVDARTLIVLNARPLGRGVAMLQPGDLLYFRQPSQTQPDHVMVFVGTSHFDRGAADWVVYHTGPVDDGPGEVRKVRLRDLLNHPAPRWRPVAANGAFVGAYRLLLL
jgi:uncharacterized protein